MADPGGTHDGDRELVAVDGQVERDHARFRDDAGQGEVEYEEEGDEQGHDRQGKPGGVEPADDEEQTKQKPEYGRSVGEQLLGVVQFVFPAQGMAPDRFEMPLGHPQTEEDEGDQSGDGLDPGQSAVNDGAGRGTDAHQVERSLLQHVEDQKQPHAEQHVPIDEDQQAQHEYVYAEDEPGKGRIQGQGLRMFRHDRDRGPYAPERDDVPDHDAGHGRRADLDPAVNAASLTVSPAFPQRDEVQAHFAQGKLEAFVFYPLLP